METMLLISSNLVDGALALATPSKDGFVSRSNLFFYLQDLLHTTGRQEVLLGEQTRLQKDISEWVERFENCQKEAEAKQQQLKMLQSEIEENKLKLNQQEMVLHIHDCTWKDLAVTCMSILLWQKAVGKPFLWPLCV